ncbi:MAG: hypothetical protein PVH73_03135 [Candidatus Bathyarchaeota archaeon]|jgi:hypothetical protein
MQKTIRKNKKKESSFQLFFLKNNATQNVEVIESDEVNFEEVKNHLERGDSIFITQKREQTSDINFIAYDQVKEPWYFVRS